MKIRFALVLVIAATTVAALITLPGAKYLVLKDATVAPENPSRLALLNARVGDLHLPGVAVAPAAFHAPAGPGAPQPAATSTDAPESKLQGKLRIAGTPMVKVPYGEVKLNKGLDVTVNADQGATVDVNLQKLRMLVPRAAVRPSSAPAKEEGALPRSPLAFATLPHVLEPMLYAPAASLTLDAHEIGTGKGVNSKWETDYGSYSRDFYRTKGIEVELRNVSGRPSGECTVTVCWMGKHLADKSVYVHHAETLPASSIQGAANATLRFWCPLLPSNETVYAALGRSSRTGSAINGWFALVSRNGHTLGGVGSSPAYRELLQNSEEVARLLAAYHPQGNATATMPHWRTDPVRDKWEEKKGDSK